MKRTKVVLMCGLLACVTPAMAGDWMGLTTDWSAVSNWSVDPLAGGFYTERCSIDPGDLGMYGGTFMPTITTGMNTDYGWARIRNGAVITQTGGDHTWINGTGDSGVSMFMYNGAQWNISAGSLTIHGRLNVGYNGTTPDAGGAESINISGNGTVSLLPSLYENVTLYSMLLNSANLGSQITIADSGEFIVNTSLQSTVDSYISSGRIVGIGNSLTTATIGDLYVVTLVPEPGSMVLLALGLGGFLMFRRNR